jgi:carbamoyltransferase
MKNNKMVILGLNGWMERGHDASACLIVDGKIVAFVEEERFSRKRYSYDAMPTQAVAYCLKEGRIKVDEIDKVVYGWNYPKSYRLRGKAFPSLEDIISKHLFPKNLYDYHKGPKITFMDHHLAHAASSYRVSGFDEASILVLDGQGEDASGTLAYANNGKIEIIQKIPIAYSLGYMMEAACKFIGLRTSDAGKLMGLAGHGKRGKLFDNFVFKELGYKLKDFPDDKEIIKECLDEQEMVIGYWKKYFEKKFKLKINKTVKYNPNGGGIVSKLQINQGLKDFALSVQLSLEEAIIYLVKALVRKTGCRNLVIAGGIGLNCSTNGLLISKGLVQGLYILPAANDAGVSLGAATETAYRLGGNKFERLDQVYLGPKYNDGQIEEALKDYKIPFKKSENIYREAAKSLNKGKVVAWFQGRMEAGPRALGNRSILANPKIKKMHEIVNKIKSRENWRPLAPSILEEYRENYFESGKLSPFMLQNHRIKKSKAKKIPAVVHKDLTSRYQSVTKNINKDYYQVIEEFFKLSKVPVVLNTSFNIAGEPIVCTPKQAISSFYSSAIDYLAIGNYWVSKK